MTKEKWLDLIDKIEAGFGIQEKYKEELGKDVPGEREIIIFNSPVLGKVKLEWIEKPRVVNEKTIYSNRIGSDVKVEKVYDENETVNYMNAYKWNKAGEEWEKISADSLTRG